MFERFTEAGRRAILFAHYEASEYGSPYIDAEHLFLGVLREGKDLFARILPGKRMALEQRIREAAEPRETILTSVDLPLSPAARRALSYAAEEAERLAHEYIGVPHLLLGLMREQSRGKALLQEFGLSLEQLREVVLREKSDPANTFFQLQRRFLALTSRLTPEIEPSFTFVP